MSSRKRKGGDPETSYVARTLARGHEHVAKKVGEEGVEVALAGALGDRKGLVSESADLLFHLLVLWSAARREAGRGVRRTLEEARCLGTRARGEQGQVRGQEMSYDDSNIFARILRGEIPNDTVYEDDAVLAFRDISPQAPVHVLVIPKGAYVSLDDFTQKASAEEVGRFFKTVGEIARSLGLEGDGFRTIANTGVNGGQEVPHFHVHLCGGRRLGRMIPQD